MRKMRFRQRLEGSEENNKAWGRTEEEIAGATAPRHTWVSVNRKGTSVSGAGEQRGGGGDEAT